LDGNTAILHTLCPLIDTTDIKSSHFIAKVIFADFLNFLKKFQFLFLVCRIFY